MMEDTDNSESNISEHHVQQDLCTTRLPYRQGRKLTAVKVYSVANESQHLLIFGVPSLNLRSELKALCSRYGTLKTFAHSLSHNELCERFTECYRVSYERIQSARVAKRQIDVKNFYGGSLHVCYAPEFEELSETRSKIMQRRRDIAYRLRNNQEIVDKKAKIAFENSENTLGSNKNIGITIKDIHENNLLHEKTKNDNLYDLNEDIFKKPIKMKIVYPKQYKPCFIENVPTKILNTDPEIPCVLENGSLLSGEMARKDLTDSDVTKVQESRKRVYEDIMNSESYKEFGNEIIKNVAVKKINKIKFAIKMSKI